MNAGWPADKALTFLKLGGSLITDKAQAQAVRAATLQRLCQEIAGARAAAPRMQLLLGHGSGSYGHTAAAQHGTRQGVYNQAQWSGFAEVWFQASRLNHLVVEALHGVGIPAVSFPASASASVRDGQILAWELSPLRSCLDRDLLPVVYGDVAFDDARGGTILSTEDLFIYLAGQLRPARILLAGREAGVWADYPARSQLVEKLTPESAESILEKMGGAAGPDVTGGMAGKVKLMLDLAVLHPDTEIRIFSGEEAGLLEQVLAGGAAGTRVSAAAGPT